MYLAIKNLFKYDETWVLIAGVAKLIFDCCYEVQVGANWLLKCDSPPQLVISSMKTLPEQMMGLNIVCKTLKRPKKGPSKESPYLQISVSAFEIRTYVSLSLKKSRFLYAGIYQSMASSTALSLKIHHSLALLIKLYKAAEFFIHKYPKKNLL